jgi:TRAP-type C4-dicarboxylate transport system substrate-binding protein
VKRLLLLLAVVPTAAAADSVTLRIATPAPEGTAWAREGHNYARELENATQGRVKTKYYFGSITGDEIQSWDRIKRGQLDGIASGGMLCMKLAPSMRVLRIVGLFQNRDESAYVSGRLRKTFDEEFRKAGFISLGELGVGPDVIFSREPVRSLAELRQSKYWVWDLDPVVPQQLNSMGLRTEPVSLEGARTAYEGGRTDGFLAVPTAALAFQWSSQVRYITDLRMNFLRGCILVASRAHDALSLPDQQAMRAHSAKLMARLEDLGRSQDEALLGGLFEKQGIKTIVPSAAFRSEFFEAARVARTQLGEQLVPKELLQKVLGMLADYRAEHRN